MRNKRLTVAASSLLLVLLACAWIGPSLHPAAAQDAVLVKDIFPGVGNSSNPEGFTEVNGTTFFSAEGFVFGTGDTGRELFKTNGTADGTVLVKDILPGIVDSIRPNEQFGVLNGILIFPADTSGATGR